MNDARPDRSLLLFAAASTAPLPKAVLRMISVLSPAARAETPDDFRQVANKILAPDHGHRTMVKPGPSRPHFVTRRCGTLRFRPTAGLSGCTAENSKQANGVSTASPAASGKDVRRSYSGFELGFETKRELSHRSPRQLNTLRLKVSGCGSPQGLLSDLFKTARIDFPIATPLAIFPLLMFALGNDRGW